MAPGNSVNVIVVGAGSIGSRHQKILRQLGHEVLIVSSRSPDAKFKTLKDALEEIQTEYVVVANSTSQHFETYSTLLEKKFSGRVLIEKPIFGQSHKLANNKFSISAVGYNLRFHPAIQWLRDNLSKVGTICSADLYVGQYLPNWRPDSDYRISSSALKLAGGGVLRDLSHELDLVQNFFGDWQRLTAIGGKLSNLDISTEDTFSILMQTKNCTVVSVHLNYLDRIKQRNITINGNNGTIDIDLIANSAKINDDQVKFSVEPDHTYIAQHQAVISGNSQDLCSLEAGLELVKTIEAIEKSARKQKWVFK